MGERRIGNLLLNGTGTPARLGRFVGDCYHAALRLFEDESMLLAVKALSAELIRRETICGKHAVEIVREYL